MFGLYSVGDCSSHERRRRAANTTETAEIHHVHHNSKEVPKERKTTKSDNYSLPRQSQHKNPDPQFQHDLEEGYSDPKVLPFGMASKDVAEKFINLTIRSRNESDANLNLKINEENPRGKTIKEHDTGSNSKNNENNSKEKSINTPNINLNLKINRGNLTKTSQIQTDGYLTSKSERNATRFAHTRLDNTPQDDGKPEPELYKGEVKGEKKADVKDAEKAKKKKKKGKPGVRQYFIAAEEIDWDYNPPWSAMGGDR